MSTPEVITHQDKLLTLDTNAGKFLQGLIVRHAFQTTRRIAARHLRVHIADGLQAQPRSR